MERRVFRRIHLLAAFFACGAGISCGAGVHDADEEQSVTVPIGQAGGRIEFMGGRLDVCPACLARETDIKFTWHRTIAHVGALSPVYDIEVPEPDTFRNDPKITISTTKDIEANPRSVIGFMVPGIDQWVPNTSTAADGCPDSTVCGPVQSQTFGAADSQTPGTTTNVVRLAIVASCLGDSRSSCPSGQSCVSSNACQECPPDSPCQ
jgi:hypothetical protein